MLANLCVIYSQEKKYYYQQIGPNALIDFNEYYRMKGKQLTNINKMKSKKQNKKSNNRDTR